MNFSTPISATVTFSGHGAYYAKERLKQLGGFFDPATKRWHVPRQNAELAAHHVALGRAANRVLEQDPELPAVRPVREREALAAKVVCWECGAAVRVDMLAGDYYCGCAEQRAQQAQLTAAKRRPFSG